MSKDIRYSLSWDTDEPYDNGIALEQDSTGYVPPPPKMNPKQDEINRLHRLLRERDEEFEKAKVKRAITTVLGFAIFYFVAMYSIYDGFSADYHVDKFGNITETPITIEAIGAMALVAIVMAGFHFVINATIFGHLANKGRAETEILERIRKQINDISK